MMTISQVDLSLGTGLKWEFELGGVRMKSSEKRDVVDNIRRRPSIKQLFIIGIRESEWSGDDLPRRILKGSG
jgi:hypothetical protein